jgi:hypothetical protein
MAKKGQRQPFLIMPGYEGNSHNFQVYILYDHYIDNSSSYYISCHTIPFQMIHLNIYIRKNGIGKSLAKWCFLLPSRVNTLG